MENYFKNFEATVAIKIRVENEKYDKVYNELLEFKDNSNFKNAIEEYYTSYINSQYKDISDEIELPDVYIKRISIPEGSNFFDGGLAFDLSETHKYITIYIVINIDEVECDYDNIEGMYMPYINIPYTIHHSKDDELTKLISNLLDRYSIIQISTFYNEQS